MFRPNDLIRVTYSAYRYSTQTGDEGCVVDSDHATSLVKMETGELAGKYRVIGNHRLELRGRRMSGGPAVQSIPKASHVRILNNGRELLGFEHADVAAATRWLFDEDLRGNFEFYQRVGFTLTL